MTLQGDWLLSRHRPFAGHHRVCITTALAIRDHWHVRVHEIAADDDFKIREGGFPIDAIQPDPMTGEPGSVFLCGDSGVSGIVGLRGSWTAEIGGPFPNMNLLFRHARVPQLFGAVHSGTRVFAVAVFQAAESAPPMARYPTLNSRPDGSWNVIWPDGGESTPFAFRGFPEFELPGTEGKPWSRPGKDAGFRTATARRTRAQTS